MSSSSRDGSPSHSESSPFIQTTNWVRASDVYPIADDTTSAAAKRRGIRPRPPGNRPKVAVSTDGSEELVSTGKLLPVLQKSALELVATGPGNNTCLDCSAPRPGFVQKQMGGFLCADCAAVHAQLFGSSSVKCFALNTGIDQEEELAAKARERGNAKINLQYEAFIPSFLLPRITHTSSPAEREEWITRKYMEKAFHAAKSGFMQTRCERTEKAAPKRMKGKWSRCWCVVKETTFEIHGEQSPSGLSPPMDELSFSSLNIAPMWEANKLTNAREPDFLSLYDAQSEYWIKLDGGGDLLEWFHALNSAHFRAMAKILMEYHCR